MIITILSLPLKSFLVTVSCCCAAIAWVNIPAEPIPAMTAAKKTAKVIVAVLCDIKSV
jgi:hypothetical protein